VKIKKSPGGQAGADGKRTLGEFGSNNIRRVQSSPLRELPPRSFKVEHGMFCRLVIAPKDSCRMNPKHLHALRMRAAWRAIRAAIKQYGSDEALMLARRMAGTWKMARSLPNQPPAFDFDETDAVSMVLDAKAWMASTGGASN